MKPNREMLNTRIDLSLDNLLKGYVNVQTKTSLKIPCIVREAINEQTKHSQCEKGFESKICLNPLKYKCEQEIQMLIRTEGKESKHCKIYAVHTK